MVHCVAFGCTNKSTGKKHTDSGKRVNFFNFPTDLASRNVWLKLLKREGYYWKQGHKICSDHFEKKDYDVDPDRMAELGYPGAKARLKPEAVPTFTYGKSTEGRKKERSAYSKRRKLETVNEALVEYDNQHDNSDTDTASETEPDLSQDGPPLSVSHVQVQVEPVTMPRLIQVTPETRSKATLAAVSTQEMGCQTSVMMTDGWTQTEEVQESIGEAQSDEEEADIDTFEFQEYDDEDTDPTYCPEQEEPEEPEQVIDLTNVPEPHKENNYLISQSCLLELFVKCPQPHCSNNVINHVRTVGTMVVISSKCKEGHSNTWYSQQTHRGMPWGNLCLSSAILFSGSTFKKIKTFLKHLKVPSISESTFYEMQRAYLIPVTVDYWKKCQEVLLRERQGVDVTVAGDGRCDSPGYCAKYCTYSLMDTTNNKILDTQVVQSNEVASSTQMELEGMKRGLTTLEESGVNVVNVVTDRHSQVKKYMREQHPEKIHGFDCWHVAKGTEKKVSLVAKKSSGKEIGPWIPSIRNHLYWVAASSGYDGEMKRAKWLSLLNHITDKHTGHGTVFPECLHGDDEESKSWLRKCSVAYKLLEPVITSPFLVRDIAKLSPVHQTYGLEVFHRVILAFAPKTLHFFYWGMVARTYLAALHYNENSENVQAVTRDGQQRYVPAYPKKYRGECVVIKPIKEDPTFNYANNLLDGVIERRKHFLSFRLAREDAMRLTRHTPPPLTAQYVRMNKDYLIDRHRSRYHKQ